MTENEHDPVEQVTPTREGTQGTARPGRPPSRPSRARQPGSDSVAADRPDRGGAPAAPSPDDLDRREERVSSRRKRPGPEQPSTEPGASEQAEAPDVPPTDPFSG